MEDLENSVRKSNKGKKSSKKTGKKVLKLLDSEAAEDDSDNDGRNIRFPNLFDD